MTHTRNLTGDVEASIARFEEFGCPPDGGAPEDPAAAVEPTPQAPAAADTSQAPKPGPHLASVHVFDPAGSVRGQLAAFDRAATAGKLSESGGAS